MASEECNTYTMVIETSAFLHRLKAFQFNLFTQKLRNGVSKTISKFKGRIIIFNDNMYMAEFDSVTNAVLCALKIQSNFKYITPKFDKSIRHLKMALCHGCDENAQILAIRMCEQVKNQFTLTSEVKKAYEKENRNTFINKEYIRTLKSSEVTFLGNLMNYTETIWRDAEFSVPQFAKPLNYSRSQVYRKLLSLTGKSPSAFIRDFRLKRALRLLYNRKGPIGSVAKSSGFKSVGYFSKCFKERFKLLPSTYIKQHA